jgi:hypothetical protein
MQMTLSSSDGSTMAGAVVPYHRVPQMTNVNGHSQLAPGEMFSGGSANSDSTGALTIGALSPGRYVVCVQMPDLPYLDPCKWSGTLGVDIVANQTTLLNVNLQKGVFLRVHINDPLSLLPPADGNPLHFAALIVGVVVGAGGYWAADLSSVTATGRDYIMPVPVNTALSLWLYSRSLTLSDQNGNVVNNLGASIPFTAESNVDEVFTVNVTGTVLGTAP